MDVIYGRNPVLEALRAQRPARKLVVAEGIREDARIREIVNIAEAAGIRVETSPRRRLDDIAHTEHHQGVAGYFHSRVPLHLQDLLDAAATPALLLALDGIQDPQNLGAIVRSAEACAVDGVVVSRRHAASLTGAAAKASAGAIEHVRISTVPNLALALDTIAAAGVARVGLDADAATRYDAFDFTQAVAIVVGAEGRGLQQLTRQHCDALVALPMLGRVASLNAGAAAAVLLYEVQRQRGFVAHGRPPAPHQPPFGDTPFMQTLIVDGYNIVHAWPELKRILETRGLEDARNRLVHVLSEYAAHTGVEVIVVFDSHERTDSAGSPEFIDGVTVRFGSRTASADHVIERLAQARSRRGDAGQVTVATGDRLQRALVGAMGVATISAEALADEVAHATTDASAARRRTEGPSGVRRVEEHLSAETREKLDAIWSRPPEERTPG